jgi:protein-S-isoprenylcysteine O-methyltransferase Ste14
MSASGRAALAFVWSGALAFAASLAVFLYAWFVTFGRPAPAGPRWPAVAWNVMLFSVFALHHSALARSGVKAALARVIPPPLERSVYVWTASVLFAGVCLLWQPVPGALYLLQGAAAVPGYLIQGAGVLLTIRSSAAIGVLDLAGVRAADRVPRAALATSGLYGFVRHPLYFAWLLLVFGAPRMTLTRFVFAVVSAAYLAVAIPFEERSLIAAFGDDYRRYQRTVRWRMVPGLY